MLTFSECEETKYQSRTASGVLTTISNNPSREGEIQTDGQVLRGSPGPPANRQEALLIQGLQSRGRRAEDSLLTDLSFYQGAGFSNTVAYAVSHSGCPEQGSQAIVAHHD